MKTSAHSPGQRSISSSDHHCGYSMIELLSVIGIATILTALAAPSYRYVTNSNRATAEVNGLVGDLQLARSAAIERGLPVTVCPSADGRTCTLNSQEWQHGWIVFVDVNGNATNEATDTLMLVQPSFLPATDSFLADPGVTAVTFDSNGFAANLPGTKTGYVTFTLHTQPQSADWTRCVQLSIPGTAMAEHAQQDGCI